MIRESIKRFGWTNPILVDAQDNVVAGHGRLEAAKALGLDEVPTIEIGDLTKAEIRAYVIADNRLAEKAGWDETILRTEFTDLASLDLDFDLEITGYDTAEIDVLLAAEEPSDEDPVELPGDAPAISRTGDLWRVGRHRLLCGDAREEANWEPLLEGEKARTIFTDPPYNVAIGGNVSGKGRRRHGEFAMASGEMSPEGYTAFLRGVFENLVRVSLDGAIHYVCMDWRHLREAQAASQGVYSELKNLCVWAKTNAGMGTFYRSQHELVLVFKAGRGRHVNAFGLGEGGRHRSNLWTYPGANTFRAGRMTDLDAHPTVKPVAMVADAIRDSSRRGELVVDAFVGAGTTLVAAARVGRIGAGIEIDPRYVDVALGRLQRETGEPAVLDGGETFEAVRAARLGEAA